MNDIVSEFMRVHRVDAAVVPYSWQWSSPESLVLNCKHFTVVIRIEQLREMLNLNAAFMRETADGGAE